MQEMVFYWVKSKNKFRGHALAPLKARAYAACCTPSACLPGIKQLWLGLQLFKTLATPLTINASFKLKLSGVLL